MQLKEWGKPTHSLYEKPRVMDDGLSHVPGLKGTMIRYGLTWLIEALGRYSPTLVWEFYASYAFIIQCDLSKGKKPLT